MSWCLTGGVKRGHTQHHLPPVSGRRMGGLGDIRWPISGSRKRILFHIFSQALQKKNGIFVRVNLDLCLCACDKLETSM